MSDPTQPIAKGQPLKPEEVAKGMTITVEHIYSQEHSISWTGVVTSTHSYGTGDPGNEIVKDWDVSLDVGTTHGHTVAMIPRPYYDVEVTAGTMRDKHQREFFSALEAALVMRGEGSN